MYWVHHPQVVCKRDRGDIDVVWSVLARAVVSGVFWSVLIDGVCPLSIFEEDAEHVSEKARGMKRSSIRLPRSWARL